MNKRIKELVEQSKCYATESTKNFTGNEPIGFMDFYTEKFAELIVRECVQESLKSSHRDDDMGAIIARQIKKHFGVE